MSTTFAFPLAPTHLQSSCASPSPHSPVIELRNASLVPLPALPAGDACGVPRPQLHGAEHAVQRVKHEQAPRERRPDPTEDLDGLDGLQGPDRTRDGAENALLGAAGAVLGGGWVRVEAAVARSILEVVDRQLAVCGGCGCEGGMISLSLGGG